MKGERKSFWVYPETLSKLKKIAYALHTKSISEALQKAIEVVNISDIKKKEKENDS